MRSFRSKPVGWRMESRRHYLAAKYGSAGASRKYLGVKETASFLRGLTDDGRAKVDGDELAMRSRHEAIESLGAEVRADIRKAEDRKELYSKDGEKFIRDQFTDMTKDYLDGKIDRSTYEEEVRRKLKGHLQLYNRKLKVFEEKKKAESSGEEVKKEEGPKDVSNPLLAPAEESKGAFTFFARKKNNIRG